MLACTPTAVIGATLTAVHGWWAVLAAVTAVGTLVAGSVACIGADLDRNGTGMAFLACLALVWAAAGTCVLIVLAPPALLACTAVGALAGGGPAVRGLRLARSASWWCMDPAGIARLRARYRVAVLHAADDRTLCRLWTRTGAALRQVPNDQAALDAYVLARSQVLDELERRHPAAFAAWFRAPDAHDMRRLLAGVTPSPDPDGR